MITQAQQPTPSAPRIAASYERVSSDDQRERETIKTQADAIARFLPLHPDLSLPPELQYRDDGVSGSIPLAERPAGRRLLQAAMAGKFEVLLVTRADRLGRDAIDLMQTRALFERLGIEVVGVMEPMDDEFGFDVRAIMAKHEKKRFLARSAEGMERAAREGRYCGGICPLGYRVRGKKQQAFLEESDDLMWGEWTEADIVRHVFRRIGIDGWSTRRVAQELNGLGVPTAYQKDGRSVRKRATQGLWRAGRIGNLVHNPIYRGEYAYGRRTKKAREIIIAPVPALVSPELWQATQDALTRNRVLPTTSRQTYLLRGVVRCGLCGLTYIGSQGRSGVWWYRCNGQLVARGPIEGRCWSRAVKGPWLDKIVWEDIEAWLQTPGEVIEELRSEVQAEAQDEYPVLTPEILRRQLDLLAEERKRAVSLSVRGLLSDADLAPEIDRIERETAGLNRRLEDLLAIHREQPAEVPFDLLERVHARLGELSMQERQMIVRALVKGVTPHTSRDEAGRKELRIVVEYRFPNLDTPVDGVAVTEPDRGSLPQ